MNLKITTIVLLLLLFSGYGNAQNIQRIDGSVIMITDLEDKIQLLQKKGNVHGLTVSIVTKDKILFQKA